MPLLCTSFKYLVLHGFVIGLAGLLVRVVDRVFAVRGVVCVCQGLLLYLRDFFCTWVEVQTVK